MVWQHDKVNRLMDHQTNVGRREEGGETEGENRLRGRGRRREIA